MIQSGFDFPLTEFEQATLEQSISYKCKDESDIEKLMNDPVNILKAKEMVHKWNSKRIKLGLKPFK